VVEILRGGVWLGEVGHWGVPLRECCSWPLPVSLSDS
jgi:hypothetical protein